MRIAQRLSLNLTTRAFLDRLHENRACQDAVVGDGVNQVPFEKMEGSIYAPAVRRRHLLLADI